MKNNLHYFYLFVFISLFFSSCEQYTGIKKTNIKVKQSNKIKHAKGFDIQYFNNYKKLIIKTPYPEAKESLIYILKSKSLSKKSELNKGDIQVPVDKIVVTSTTHIPMLELLGEENSLVGFQDTNYISSEKTRKRIDSGFVRELGKEAAMNTEVLFELQPDLVVGFAMNKTNKTYNLIE